MKSKTVWCCLIFESAVVFVRMLILFAVLGSLDIGSVIFAQLLLRWWELDFGYSLDWLYYISQLTWALYGLSDKGIATSNKGNTTRRRTLLVAPGIATSNTEKHESKVRSWAPDILFSPGSLTINVVTKRSMWFGSWTLQQLRCAKPEVLFQNNPRPWSVRFAKTGWPEIVVSYPFQTGSPEVDITTVTN